MPSGSSNRTAEIQSGKFNRFSPNLFYIDTFISSNFSMPRQAYNTISRLDEERLREVYRNGGDFLNIATQLNINRTPAYNIVRGGVVRKNRGGKLGKNVDSSMLELIVGILEENSLVTVSNLNKELRRRYPNKPEICDKTLSNAIDGLAFTLKLSRDTPAQQNSSETNVDRKQHVEWRMSAEVVNS